jgi:hypothetical protein
MIVNRAHIPWFIFTLLATAVATGLYLANFYPASVPFKLPPVFGPVPPVRHTIGGTPLGLLFGIFSYLVFLFAALLGLRKKRRTWPIGHVQRWLRAHIWLTILTVPLVLFHCGFHFGGFLTSGLMALYFIVMISGFYGLALQQFMPGMIARRIPQEAVFEAIPHVREELVEAAEKLWEEFDEESKKMQPPRPVAATLVVQSAGGTALLPPPTEDEELSRKAIGAFLRDECLPYLRLADGREHRLANQRAADDRLRGLKMTVTPKWQQSVICMEQWCYDRRLLDVQVRYHHWLHAWLLVHVPFSFVLLVVTFWHAYMAIVYLKPFPS